MLRNTFAALLIATAVFSGNAFADDMLAIETTNVASIDSVFSPISSIHTKLSDTQTQLGTIEENIRTALGVATDAPLETALADFKAQAGDALSLTMDGTMPKLTVADAAPQNIKDGVTALQTAFTDLNTIVTTLPTLADDAMAVVTAAQGLDPKALAGEIKSSGQKLGKTLKLVNSNRKATQQTPDHIQTTLGSATGLMDSLVAPFK